jgi:hypothetical protein
MKAFFEMKSDGAFAVGFLDQALRGGGEARGGRGSTWRWIHRVDARRRHVAIKPRHLLRFRRRLQHGDGLLRRKLRFESDRMRVGGAATLYGSIAITRLIAGFEADRLTAVARLRRAMWEAGDQDAANARHADMRAPLGGPGFPVQYVNRPRNSASFTLACSSSTWPDWFYGIIWTTFHFGE